MNWNTIQTDSPDAFALLPLQVGHFRSLYDFFDQHGIVVVIGYEAARYSPWKWSVHYGLTECSSPPRYAKRELAEAEAFELAFHELNKQVLKGNA